MIQDPWHNHTRSLASPAHNDFRIWGYTTKVGNPHRTSNAATVSVGLLVNNNARNIGLVPTMTLVPSWDVRFAVI